MNPKLIEWITLLFDLRVPKQVVCVLDGRVHPDIRNARTHLKNFEIWRMSKTVCLYPEGYRVIPPEDFRGLDGTVPALKEEQTARDLGYALREWLMLHKDAKIVFIHDNDQYWRDVCGIADAFSTGALTITDLGSIFDLDTGEKHDQQVEWPRRLGDFLNDLNEVEAEKITNYIVEQGV